jgi:hypothetical protein
MSFVYLPMFWFGCWISLGIESYPFGLAGLRKAAVKGTPTRAQGDPGRPAGYYPRYV